MDSSFTSDGIRLEAQFFGPPRQEPDLPGLVLCHGYPPTVVGSAGAFATFPVLAERIATQLGWAVLTFAFRGCGSSGGNFSLGGWLRDLDAAAEHLLEKAEIGGLWFAGFGTGGSLCLCAAKERPDVRGVAVLGSTADFDDWASHPRRLVQHAREMGLIRDREQPASVDEWARDFRRIRPVDAARALPPRPLLVVHGSDDDDVPSFDGRVLSDAHGDAELRIIQGAGHALRHDPRAVAVLLGWLDRQKHRVRTA
jgi:putative redox protein